MSEKLNAARSIRLSTLALILTLPMWPALSPAETQPQLEHPPLEQGTNEISYHTVKVNGINIFYREAGRKNAPTLLLLHGFPTSSHMFRNLIPKLADRYHLIAPDYPGFGQSDAPPIDKFEYTFDHIAQLIDNFTAEVGLSKYALYVQDYGAPIGFRIASAHPERVTAIVVQNGVAYEEGLNKEFWKPLKAFWADKSEVNATKLRGFLELPITKWQYTEGARNASLLSPDAWTLDQAYMDRPGNKDIQIAMMYSYNSNVKKYAEWQEYFRKHQPPMLIAWGKNDKTFDVQGATAYQRDLPKAELHLLDTGHFALEEDSTEIARLMRDFLGRTVKTPAH